MEQPQLSLLRLGLVLQLLASLLVAPDLIGRARWAALQRRLLQSADVSTRLLAGLGREPKNTGSVLAYWSSILVDAAANFVLFVVLVAAAILLATIVPAYLVGPWLGRVVLAAWAIVFVATATAVEVRAALGGKVPRRMWRTLTRIVASPATGTMRLIVFVGRLAVIAVLQAGALVARRAARASGSITTSLAREGSLSALLLPVGLTCLVLGTVFQLIATL